MSQFFSIHAIDPQIRLLKQACAIIEKGGIIVYPTDSGYALGCALGNKDAMERIIAIREISDDHNFSLMCRDLSELSAYTTVDNQAYRVIKKCTPGPYTFVLKANKEVPRRLMHPKRKTIGIRVPDNVIVLKLLDELNAPLMSTSLIMPGNEITESDPFEIRDLLEKKVDLIIDGGNIPAKPTSVIDMSTDELIVLREGAGNLANII